MLLRINNLTVDFIEEEEHTRAVSNVSLEVEKGKITAIVGESGSGKSVTALSILQLLPPDKAKYNSGKILFSEDGDRQIDLLNLNSEELQKIRGNKISMIFQEPMTSLNPVKTCGSQVIEAIQLHQKKNKSDARNTTINLFRECGLTADTRRRYPHQLSGGQKQRVMIAMAMSCNPALLIADEPTTALDVTVQKTILELIKNLQRQHDMGVIYITHDLSLVATIADSVVVMYKGAIVETGSVEEICLHAKHPYTKALLACRPALYSKGTRLPVVTDFTNTESVQLSSTPDGASTESVKTFSEILVEVKNLSVSFPVKTNFFGKTLSEFKALEDISFDLYKGETLGVVGESGSGKTTLGRALLRLVEPSSGEIFLAGRNIAYIPENEMRKLRKNIQIIFQDPYGSLNPRITIGSAIEEPLSVHRMLRSRKERKDKVIELLEKVDLKSAHYNRYPHQFSGGQRQRICIARALALNPEFIVCDESVSALDVSVQAQVLNLLNDLKKLYGFTCIFISHDLGVVKYISDRILVLNKGRIEEIGSANEIYYQPKKAYTQSLIEAIPIGFS